MDYKITESYLKELITFCGNDSCGKILKRIETIDDKESLKACVKELVYEGYRNFKHLLKAYNDGSKTTIFDFKSRVDS